MLKPIGALEARSSLGQLVDEVQDGTAQYLIKKRDATSAVLMSYADYLRLTLPKDPLITSIQASAHAAGSDKLTDAEIHAIISEARQDAHRL